MSRNADPFTIVKNKKAVRFRRANPGTPFTPVPFESLRGQVGFLACKDTLPELTPAETRALYKSIEAISADMAKPKEALTLDEVLKIPDYLPKPEWESL